MAANRRSGSARSFSRVVRACAALAALVLVTGSLIMVRFLDTPDIAVAYVVLVVVWPLTALVACLLGSLALWLATRPWRSQVVWAIVCVGSVLASVLMALQAGDQVSLAILALIIDASVLLTGWICLTDRPSPDR